MDWAAHQSHWPNSAHSEFHAAAPHRWHIQRAGSGPTALLIHGAGGSTHSWDRVFSGLAQSHTAVAIDLPGQGFTTLGDKSRCGLPAMAEDVTTLLDDLAIRPDIIIGHSAGAAIAVALATSRTPQPRILSINGAFQNFSGVAGFLFPAFARLLSINPATGHLFAAMSGTASGTARLIASTGSRIPSGALAQYRALISDPDHVNATLAMMAQWSLDTMPQMLASLTAEAHFIVASNDRTVRPAASRDAAAMAPNSKLHLVQHGGHLLHEEDPAAILAYIKSEL